MYTVVMGKQQLAHCPQPFTAAGRHRPCFLYMMPSLTAFHVKLVEERVKESLTNCFSSGECVVKERFCLNWEVRWERAKTKNITFTQPLTFSKHRGYG